LRGTRGAVKVWELGDGKRGGRLFFLCTGLELSGELGRARGVWILRSKTKQSAAGKSGGIKRQKKAEESPFPFRLLSAVLLRAGKKAEESPFCRGKEGQRRSNSRGVNLG